MKATGSVMTNTPPKLKVFLYHASEDKPIVRELYDRLRMDGFDPWLDSELLVPGENWPLEIQKAMRASQAVIVSLSEAAIVKEGYIHTEIKTAQSLQLEKTEGTIFFIPLQLEKCDLPFSMRDIQWGRYFEPDGYERLVKALNKRAEQVKAAQGFRSGGKADYHQPQFFQRQGSENTKSPRNIFPRILSFSLPKSDNISKIHPSLCPLLKAERFPFDARRAALI